MIRELTTSLALSLLSSSAFASAGFDLSRYTGKWYEAASTKPIFQANCTCTEVRYQINQKNNVTVENMCRKYSADGAIDYVKVKLAQLIIQDYSKLLSVAFLHTSLTIKSWMLQMIIHGRLYQAQ